MFADELFDELRLPRRRQKIALSLSIELFPDLLRNFAIMKRQLSQSPQERKASAFIRHSRVAISSELNEIVLTSDFALNIPYQTALDPSDKFDRWQLEPGSLPEEELHDRWQAEQAEEDSQTTESIEGLDIPEARQFLLEGQEYEWLVSRLRTVLSMNAIGCRIYAAVHEAFFEGFGAGSQDDSVDMQVDLEWNPRTYVLSQFGSIVDLSQTIVLVCHESNFYAVTCMEYLEQVWPLRGKSVLSAVNNLIEDGNDIVRLETKDCSISLQLLETRTRTTGQGNSAALNDIFEILV